MYGRHSGQKGGKPAQRTPRVNRPRHSVTQFSLSVSAASSTASSSPFRPCREITASDNYDVCTHRGRFVFQIRGGAAARCRASRSQAFTAVAPRPFGTQCDRAIARARRETAHLHCASSDRKAPDCTLLPRMQMILDIVDSYIYPHLPHELL